MAPEFLAVRLENTEKLKLFISFEDARRTGVRGKPVFDYDKLRPGDYLAICSAVPKNYAVPTPLSLTMI